MNNLYNIDDANLILQKKKKYQIITIICSIFAVALVVLLTILSTKTIIMIVDIVVVSIWLSYLYTYFFFIVKELNNRYHLLATIEQYDHLIVDSKIESISQNTYTINDLLVYEINLENSKVIYIEKEKIANELSKDSNIRFELVDNLVVGYEVLK